MLTKEQIREMVMDCLSGYRHEADDANLIVASPFMQPLREDVCVNARRRLQESDSPILLSSGTPFAMTVGLASKMIDERYFEEWLSLATNSSGDPEGDFGMNTKNVYCIPVNSYAGRNSDSASKKDEIFYASIDVLKIRTSGDQVLEKEIETYVHYVEVLRPYLGEAWYEKVINSISKTPIKELVTRLVSGVRDIVLPSASDAKSVKVYSILDDKTEAFVYNDFINKKWY